MISEAAYMDQLRNCAKFNRKFNLERRRQRSFFDQQTGIVQRPSHHLVCLPSDRHKPLKPNEVLRYRAERWRKKTDVNFDAVEFKFILSMDPALKHAVESLINPEQPVVHIPSDMSNDSINMKSNGGKTNFEQVEYEEYRDDDFDQDFSDEDDWDNKKKKRKRAKDMSFKQNYSRKSFPGPSSSNTPSSASTSDDRPFGCNECNARYKSKPGLLYHQKHAHSTAESPNMTTL